MCVLVTGCEGVNASRSRSRIHLLRCWVTSRRAPGNATPDSNARSHLPADHAQLEVHGRLGRLLYENHLICYGRGAKRQVVWWTPGVVGAVFGTTRGRSRPRPGISHAAAADERPGDPAFATVMGRQACASQTPLMCAQ